MDTYRKLYRAIRDHSDMDDSQIIEAGEHGADAGWPGFTYSVDSVRFCDENETAIWELAQDMADGLCEPNVPAMVAKFRRADILGSPSGFKELLAWFALEEVGRWLANNPSEGDGDEEDEG